jgi:hypothetical protein
MNQSKEEKVAGLGRSGSSESARALSYSVLTNYFPDLDSAEAAEATKNLSIGAERENCMRGVGREPRGKANGWILRL